LAGATDATIWRLAAERDLVIVSKDEDFFYLASAPESKSKLVWIRLGNCRTKTLLAAIEQVWPKIEASLKAGDRIIEIR
jgi:predicted nuclease of predicted toxin-antitoxin system